jgi:hypothetical protein
MNSKTKLFIVISVAFIFLSVSAIENQNPQWKGTIEEETGVKVIKNPNEPLYGEITFDLEEDLSIGNEEDENYVFYSGVQLAVDSSGNIFALDRGNYRVQKYDKNGKYLQTIGRHGQGPGEFEHPNRLSLDTNENIYVIENRRIHGFNNNGDLLNTITIKQDEPRRIREFMVAKEGDIICHTHLLGERKNIEPPDYFLSNIDLFDSTGKFIETIATYRTEIEFLKVGERSWTSPSNYHESKLFFCPLDEELSVYGHSSEYKLFVINSSADVVFKFERKKNPQPLTNEVKDKILDYIVESMKKGKTGRKLSRGEVKKTMNFPKYKPFFNDIITDKNGRIYVKRFKSRFDEDEIDNYDLFNKDGYYLFNVKISVRNPLIRNGYIYSSEICQETGYTKIKRYKIKNWKQIRDGY